MDLKRLALILVVSCAATVANSQMIESKSNDRQEVRGVGSVSGVINETLAWNIAENRARAYLAQNLETYVAPFIRRYKAGDAGSAQAGSRARDNEEINRGIQEAINRVAFRIAASARVIEHRKNGIRYFVTVAIEVKEARRAFDGAEELNPFR